jgi:hypothetical protein
MFFSNRRQQLTPHPSLSISPLEQISLQHFQLIQLLLCPHRQKQQAVPHLQHATSLPTNFLKYKQLQPPPIHQHQHVPLQIQTLNQSEQRYWSVVKEFLNCCFFLVLGWILQIYSVLRWAIYVKV